MSVTVFLSTVSDEFRPYRDQLNSSLTRHNVNVKVQEDFKDYGDGTLDGLDVLISHCDAVLHLVGDMTGAETDLDHEQAVLLGKRADLATRFAPLATALASGERLTYTQWEAWLALYHGKKLLIAKAAPEAPRGEKYLPTDASRAEQARHLARLNSVRRFENCVFANAAELVNYTFSSGILDLLVEDYANEMLALDNYGIGYDYLMHVSEELDVLAKIWIKIAHLASRKKVKATENIAKKLMVQIMSFQALRKFSSDLEINGLNK